MAAKADPSPVAPDEISLIPPTAAWPYFVFVFLVLFSGETFPALVCETLVASEFSVTQVSFQNCSKCR